MSQRSRSIARYLVWSCLAGVDSLPSVVSADENAAAPFGAPVDDQRLFIHAQLDQFEVRTGESTPTFRWNGEGWAGTDDYRLILKTEGSVTHGTAQDGQHELLYSKPVSPYFDLQAGLRYDLDSDRGRGWVAVGVEGLTPYFFRLAATVYASDAGHLAAQLASVYPILITQRLILEPQIELNAYSRPDVGRNVGSGLSSVDAGIRLRYEIRREFAPYLGVTYTHTRGSAANENDWNAVAGLRLWF